MSIQSYEQQTDFMRQPSRLRSLLSNRASVLVRKINTTPVATTE